jgi:hypothetical protein
VCARKQEEERRTGSPNADEEEVVSRVTNCVDERLAGRDRGVREDVADLGYNSRRRRGLKPTAGFGGSGEDLGYSSWRRRRLSPTAGFGGSSED